MSTPSESLSGSSGTTQLGHRARDLFIVSCTRRRKEETLLYRSLTKLGTERFRFFENNRLGLSSCYNSVLDDEPGGDGIIVFVHDDVTIGDLFLHEKLNEAFDKHGFAIAGVAGTAGFRIDPSLETTMWNCPPQEAWSGWVEHCPVDASAQMSCYVRAYGPVPRPCVVLDGLFLAIDSKKAGHLRFDEQFPFHFYDLDFCLTAHQEGLSLGTCNVYVTHSSVGSYSSPDFKEAQNKFRAKWLPRQPQPAVRNNPASPGSLMPQSKPGRNDPCFCGSGRKYKRCHGA
jgi:hypothetical protein